MPVERRFPDAKTYFTIPKQRLLIYFGTLIELPAYLGGLNVEYLCHAISHQKIYPSVESPTV